MEKQQSRAVFNMSQQSLADKQRYKFIQTQEDVSWWHPAYSSDYINDGGGVGHKYVRVGLTAEFGVLSDQAKARGLNGQFFVVVRDADDTSRRSPSMSYEEALKLYELMVDNITVAQLFELGFQNG